MKLQSVAAILKALNDAEVRVLVAGGLAVNAHGYLRFTNDADLVIQFEPQNIERTFRALATLGYQPRVPVTAHEFADPDVRERLIRDKEMKVLQFWSDAHRETPVDVFVIAPFDFPMEYAHAIADQIEIPEHPRVDVRYVRLPTLIAMKEAVGRPRDLDDVQHLRWIQEDKGK